MVSDKALERLEREMWEEEMWAEIIDIPEVTDISETERTIFILSEEVRTKVIQLIEEIPDGKEFLGMVKIEVSR